jgi:ATP diphosphatase|tara:strand:- start:83 stop:913 length:831 start_codon:yes stop_codon:yes gene_type:complete
MTNTPPPSFPLRPMDRLVEIMATLRNPNGGCPWDVEQTFATIAPHTIEEAYEVADAIEQNDMDSLKDELGDLLFQSVFHAQMAKELNEFSFDDVVNGVIDKMIRRHPHVFGDQSIKTADEQTVSWEDIKATERATKSGAADESALAGLTNGLPALIRAEKLQKRAARVGFDWPEVASVFDKLREETSELQVEIDTDGGEARLTDELGDLLFVCVNLARKLNIDAETALRGANSKFETRFRHMELALKGTGRGLKGMELDAMEEAWQGTKKALAEQK